MGTNYGTVERNHRHETTNGDSNQTLTDPGLSKAEEKRRAVEQLDEVRQYFRDLQARREVIAVTRTPMGQTLDWVPAESLTPDGTVADPPDEGGGVDLRSLRTVPADDSGNEVRPAELVTFELADNNVSRGPYGTVPLVRRDLDRLTTAKALSDLLSKHGRAMRLQPDGARAEAALPEDGTAHKYAYSAQWVTCFGCEGNINAWDPYGEWSDEFTLGQCALARGSGGAKQTIEAGHQQYRDLYGDWVPHLFIFYTTNGYTSSGDNKGGYNQDVRGWVQVSTRIYPEALSTPVSVFGGTQYVMSLKWQLSQGNWWLRVNGDWIGYYPASLFATTGLRNQAEKCAWYGEVVDSGSHAGTTATDMGNGHWPYEGWQHCAYMNNLLYQSTAGGQMARYSPASSSVYGSHPKCYNVEGHFDNTGSWGPYFWWGGSGKNSQCP